MTSFSSSTGLVPFWTTFNTSDMARGNSAEMAYEIMRCLDCIQREESDECKRYLFSRIMRTYRKADSEVVLNCWLEARGLYNFKDNLKKWARSGIDGY